MKNKIITIFIGITLLLGLATILDNCSNKTQFKEELKANEKEKVIIDQKKKTATKIVRKVDGTVETNRIEGVRKVEVSISNSGVTSIKTRNRGAFFEPGISLFYSKDQMNLGLEIQWLYWRKYGISIGFGLSHTSKCSAYISCNYNIYSNSSFFIGLNDYIRPVVGLKVSF